MNIYISLKNYLKKEELAIIDLIFGDPKSDINLQNIDLDKLIYLASSYLLLPLLFSKISEKKIISKFPNELIIYLNEIFNINLNRNKELLVELNQIVTEFKKKEVEFTILEQVKKHR